MNHQRLISIGLAGALLAGAGCAHAQDRHGSLYPSILLTSDYRFDGASFSGHAPTAQASVYWARPDNFYGGLWLSGVDFSDLGDTTTSYEIDFYGGFRFTAGKASLAAELMYSAFPDKRIPGPTYNFYTAKLRATQSMRRFQVDSELSYVPEGAYASGHFWRIASRASRRWNDWLTTSAGVGRRFADIGLDRSFLDIGATIRWNRVAFDLRYTDTNHNFVECGYVDWCEAGMTLTMQIDLWE